MSQPKPPHNQPGSGPSQPGYSPVVRPAVTYPPPLHYVPAAAVPLQVDYNAFPAPSPRRAPYAQMHSFGQQAYNQQASNGQIGPQYPQYASPQVVQSQIGPIHTSPYTHGNANVQSPSPNTYPNFTYQPYIPPGQYQQYGQGYSAYVTTPMRSSAPQPSNIAAYRSMQNGNNSSPIDSPMTRSAAPSYPPTPVVKNNISDFVNANVQSVMGAFTPRKPLSAAKSEKFVPGFETREINSQLPSVEKNVVTPAASVQRVQEVQPPKGKENAKPARTLPANKQPQPKVAKSEPEFIQRPTKPTVVFIPPGPISITAQKLTGTPLPLPKQVEKTAPAQASTSQESFGLDYLKSSPDVSKINGESETRSIPTKEPKAEDVPATFDFKKVPTGPRSDQAFKNVPSGPRFKSAPTGPRSTHRYFSAPTTVPGRNNTADPDLQDFIAGTSSRGAGIVDPDLQDFLAGTKSGPKAADADLDDFLAATTARSEKMAAGKKSVELPKKASSLGRFFKKSFAEVLKIEKPSSKIRIASVKVRPGFGTTGAPEKHSRSGLPPSSQEDGEIVEPYLPFDYTSSDRPKVPRPLVTRVDSGPNDILSYDVPEFKTEFKTHKRSLSDISQKESLWSPPTFSRTPKEGTHPKKAVAQEPRPASIPSLLLPIKKSTSPVELKRSSSPSPPPPSKRSRVRRESSTYKYDPLDIPSDLDPEDTIVVDVSAWLKNRELEQSEDEKSTGPPPRKKRLARRSEVKGTRRNAAADDDSDDSRPAKKRLNRRSETKVTRLSTAADNKSDDLTPARRRLVRRSEMKAAQLHTAADYASDDSAVKKPAKRDSASKQSPPSAESNLRHATKEEMQQIIDFVEEIQYDALTEARYDKPTSYDECVPESNWQPYKCFVCGEKWSMNAEITKHLEKKHSIVMLHKVKAWQCFFPMCSKAFCDRTGALKHAKSHFGGV